YRRHFFARRCSNRVDCPSRLSQAKVGFPQYFATTPDFFRQSPLSREAVRITHIRAERDRLFDETRGGVSPAAVSSPAPNRLQSRRFSDSCCAARRSIRFAPMAAPAR